MKQFAFCLWIICFVFVVGCQPTETITPTAGVPEEVLSQIVERPSSTAAATFTADKTAVTPTSIATDEPPVTLAPTTITPSPMATQTALPLPTYTPTATPSGLPIGLPLIETNWVGIGTAVPSSTAPISTHNLDTLVEVARWGKGEILQGLYSPDGRYLYIRTQQGIYLYDAATAQQLEFRPYLQPPGYMALSPNGKMLAIASSSSPYYVELRDAETNSFIGAFYPFHNANIIIKSLSFDASGETLFATTFSYEETTTTAWDITNILPLATLENSHNFAIASQAPIAATRDGDEIQLWQWQDNSFIALNRLAIPDSLDSTTIAISPNGQYLALGQNIYTMNVAIWRVSDGELLHLFNLKRSHISGKRVTAPAQLSGPGRENIAQLQFSPDSQFLAATTGYQSLLLWHVAEGQLLRTLDEVGEQLMFSPDGTTIATWTHALSQWRVEDGSFINVLNQHIGSITDIDLIPQRNQLAIASQDRFVYIRRSSDGALAASLRAGVSNNNSLSSPRVAEIDVTADGNTLVSASNDAYRVWDLNDYSMIPLQPSPRGDVGASGVAISFDGMYLMGREHDQAVYLWQGKQWIHSYTPFVTLQSMAFSPTELLLALDDFYSDNLILWRPDSGESRLLPSANTYVASIAFSADGRLLAAIDRDGELDIWTVAGLDAEPLHTFLSQLKDWYGGSINFSPDNQLLALANKNSIEFWDLSTGSLAHTLSLPVAVSKVLFTPDGRYLITGHTDGSVRFWAVP